MVHSPELLNEYHHLQAFDCGVDALNHWIRHRALQNQHSGASRTYVVCSDEKEVLAYYALAAGAIDSKVSPGRVRRNMPNPIPVSILARLAVAKKAQRQGLGRALVYDACCRVLQAGDLIGIRAILVYAISLEARAFYLGLGFEESPIDPMMLMVNLSDLEREFGKLSA